MLDLHTLALINVVSAVVFSLATLTVRSLLPQGRSLRDWTLGSIIMAASSLLLGLRGFIPDFLSIVIANSGLVLSIGFIHVGTRKLFNIHVENYWHWLGACGIFLAYLVYTYFSPNLTARIITLSVLMFPFFMACGWIFWRRGDSNMKSLDRITAVIFITGALIFLIRGMMARDIVVSADFKTTPSWIVISPYIYTILFNVSMSIMLTLKVSTYLQQQLADSLSLAEATNRDLMETVEFNEAILFNSPLPMGIYATSGQCILANDAYASAVGATREALLDQNFNSIEGWKISGLLNDCLAAVKNQSAQLREIHLITSFGKEIWFECRILPTHLKGKIHLLIQFIDLSDRKRLENVLRHLAFHDSLTELPNRRLLIDRLTQAIHHSKRRNSYVAVLFLDLNKFKKLNDDHGHSIGDKLLIEVAIRLQQSVRESDTVGRVGGDEFIIILNDLSETLDIAMKYATGVCEKIKHALSNEYVLSDIRYHGSISVGMKLFQGDDDTPDQILKEVDIAMYKQKRQF